MENYFTSDALFFQGRIFITVTIYPANISQSGNIVKRGNGSTRRMMNEQGIKRAD